MYNPSPDPSLYLSLTHVLCNPRSLLPTFFLTHVLVTNLSSDLNGRSRGFGQGYKPSWRSQQDCRGSLRSPETSGKVSQTINHLFSIPDSYLKTDPVVRAFQVFYSLMPLLTLSSRAFSSDMFAAASRLLAPQLRTTTMLLASTWLLNMMGYYGVVLLATEIHLAPEAATGAADAAAGSEWQGGVAGVWGKDQGQQKPIVMDMSLLSTRNLYRTSVSVIRAISPPPPRFSSH